MPDKPIPWIEGQPFEGEMRDALFLLEHAVDPLTVLRAGAILRTIGHTIREQATADARLAGHTWGEIGEANRTSRQAEHRRFAYLDDPEADAEA